MEVVLLLHGLKVHLMAVAVGYTDTTCKASGEGSSSNISSFVCVCVCVCVLMQSNLILDKLCVQLIGIYIQF